MRVRFAVAGVLAGALACGAPCVRADAIELLPSIEGHAEFTRFAPTERDFVWTGWLGGGATLLKAGRTSVFMMGDVETILGKEYRVFDANQANYILEGGLRLERAGWTFSGVFHHVSRHVVDRPKRDSVDWNMASLRAERGFKNGDETRGRLRFGIGRTMKRTFVNYRWEFRAEGDYDLAETGGIGAFYSRASLRAVTEKRVTPDSRGSFIDAVIEGGWRLRRADRAIHFFVAYEHRNDVYLFNQESRDRTLYGFRVGFGANPGW